MSSVLKPIKADADPANPWGATIKEDDKLIRAQRHYIGKDGKEHLSALNIVNEEGNWNEWSKTLSSQFLAKQRPELIRSQLKEAYDIRKDEFDEIRLLTNKAVQQKLLDSFADDCDAAAVHLLPHLFIYTSYADRKRSVEESIPTNFKPILKRKSLQTAGFFFWYRLLTKGFITLYICLYQFQQYNVYLLTIHII